MPVAFSAVIAAAWKNDVTLNIHNVRFIRRRMGFESCLIPAILLCFH